MNPVSRARSNPYRGYQPPPARPAAVQAFSLLPANPGAAASVPGRSGAESPYAAQTAQAARTAVTQTERRLAALVRQGKEGVPLHYWVRDGKIVGQARTTGRAGIFMLLEGLNRRDLARCLARAQVQRALRDVPAHDDPDLATSFSIAARCRGILR